MLERNRTTRTRRARSSRSSSRPRAPMLNLQPSWLQVFLLSGILLQSAQDNHEGSTTVATSFEEISVRKIAETKVDREAVRAWLNELGATEFEIPSEET